MSLMLTCVLHFLNNFLETLKRREDQHAGEHSVVVHFTKHDAYFRCVVQHGADGLSPHNVHLNQHRDKV